MKETLRTYIYETEMQKHVRLEHEFANLAQGNSSHADFRAMFESKLMDMQVCPKFDMPTERTLFVKYLSKLNPGLAQRI